MPWSPDPDTVIKIGWIVALLAFLVAVVSAIGEVRGWWGLIGEIGMTVGGTVSVLVGLGTLWFSAGRDQVDAVDEQLDSMDHTLGGVDDKLDSMDGKLDKLDSMDGKLDKLDDLDRVQVELDAQTGVLDRQVELLADIRDQL